MAPSSTTETSQPGGKPYEPESASHSKPTNNNEDCHTLDTLQILHQFWNYSLDIVSGLERRQPASSTSVHMRIY